MAYVSRSERARRNRQRLRHRNYKRQQASARAAKTGYEAGITKNRERDRRAREEQARLKEQQAAEKAAQEEAQRKAQEEAAAREAEAERQREREKRWAFLETSKQYRGFSIEPNRGDSALTEAERTAQLRQRRRRPVRRSSGSGLAVSGATAGGLGASPVTLATYGGQGGQQADPIADLANYAGGTGGQSNSTQALATYGSGQEPRYNIGFNSTRNAEGREFYLDPAGSFERYGADQIAKAIWTGQAPLGPYAGLLPGNIVESLANGSYGLEQGEFGTSGSVFGGGLQPDTFSSRLGASSGNPNAHNFASPEAFAQYAQDNPQPVLQAIRNSGQRIDQWWDTDHNRWRPDAPWNRLSTGNLRLGGRPVFIGDMAGSTGYIPPDIGNPNEELSGSEKGRLAMAGQELGEGIRIVTSANMDPEALRFFQGHFFIGTGSDGRTYISTQRPDGPWVPWDQTHPGYGRFALNYNEGRWSAETMGPGYGTGQGADDDSLAAGDADAASRPHFDQPDTIRSAEDFAVAIEALPAGRQAQIQALTQSWGNAQEQLDLGQNLLSLVDAYNIRGDERAAADWRNRIEPLKAEVQRTIVQINRFTEDMIAGINANELSATYLAFMAAGPFGVMAGAELGNRFEKTQTVDRPVPGQRPGIGQPGVPTNQGPMVRTAPQTERPMGGRAAVGGSIGGLAAVAAVLKVADEETAFKLDRLVGRHFRAQENLHHAIDQWERRNDWALMHRDQARLRQLGWQRFRSKNL